MKFKQRYIEYLKDNPEGYWFKRKVYGWGWIPATREGWIVLIAFIALYTWILVNFIQTQQFSSDINRFIIEIAAWAVALMAICWRTGEPPKWQWGIPESRK